MLYRKAYQKLLDWKEAGAKQALCIVGARQIGKTTLVREFAKAEYKAFYISIVTFFCTFYNHFVTFFRILSLLSVTFFHIFRT